LETINSGLELPGSDFTTGNSSLELPSRGLELLNPGLALPNPGLETINSVLELPGSDFMAGNSSLAFPGSDFAAGNSSLELPNPGAGALPPVGLATRSLQITRLASGGFGGPGPHNGGVGAAPPEHWNPRPKAVTIPSWK
jgi:hypothetical protein